MEPERAVRTADTVEEWNELLRSDDPNIVRSREDWDALIGDDERRKTIFPNSDEAAISAFTESLAFRNGGLASGDYSMLADSITIKKLEELVTNFGIGERLFTDYNGHKCDGMHNCLDGHPHSICTSNC